MRSKGALGILLLAVLLLVGGCAGCSTYNKLVTSEESLNAAWGNVQSAYQRRADLIPNLVATAQNAADMEMRTLEALTSAQAKASEASLSSSDLRSADKLAEFQRAQDEVRGSLDQLIGSATPSDAFRDLQAQIEGSENRINVERRRYNEAVRSFNESARRFPSSIFAGLFGFDARPPFEASSGS